MSFRIDPPICITLLEHTPQRGNRSSPAGEHPLGDVGGWCTRLTHLVSATRELSRTALNLGKNASCAGPLKHAPEVEQEVMSFYAQVRNNGMQATEPAENCMAPLSPACSTEVGTCASPWVSLTTKHFTNRRHPL